MSGKEELKKYDVVCPYCNEPALLVDSTAVYRRSYGYIYLCKKCGAFVTCHPGTTRPLGTMANASLRRYRRCAHGAFDALWGTGVIKRTKAYEVMSEYLGIPKEECHIGMFREDMCRRVFQFVADFCEGKIEVK